MAHGIDAVSHALQLPESFGGHGLPVTVCLTREHGNSRPVKLIVQRFSHEERLGELGPGGSVALRPQTVLVYGAEEFNGSRGVGGSGCAPDEDLVVWDEHSDTGRMACLHEDLDGLEDFAVPNADTKIVDKAGSVGELGLAKGNIEAVSNIVSGVGDRVYPTQDLGECRDWQILKLNLGGVGDTSIVIA